jgi:diguanylate cyclase (GGDEF)-like protein/PAS domain S-box-containing protein
MAWGNIVTRIARRKPVSAKATQAALTEARLEVEAAIQQARQAEERLKAAIDILPEGVVFLDAEGRYIMWNKQYAEMYVGSADLFHVGAKLEDTLREGVYRGQYPEAVGREEEWLKARLERLYEPKGRHEQKTADGRWIMIDERRTSDGGLIGLRVDITEMKKREESFRLLFDNNPVPMYVHARDDGRILAVNDAATHHYGYSRAEFLRMKLRNLSAPEMGASVQPAGPVDGQDGITWKHQTSTGEIIEVAVYSSYLTYEGVSAVLIGAVDITERKRAEARIAFMAHHDALTGLPNRVLFRERMEEALLRMRRDETAAVLCLDLDDFKTVNDTLGHPVGDRLLEIVSERLQSELREGDTVARLGGDEFAVLQTGIDDPEDAGALAARLIDIVSAPYELDGHLVSIGVSIGISVGPGDGDDCDRLLKSADMALYRAKAEGRGAYRFFEPEMDARLQARRRLELDLRGALAAEALDVHYQPLVDIGSGDIVGFEALVRWNHPERGAVSPVEFIPIAEETGLVVQLGAFVLRRACMDAASWPDGVKVAVNLSPLQFRSGGLFTEVTKSLNEAGLAPGRLELEITETLLLEKSDQVLATLHALRALGVRISMDDFGTGYSSLSYLRSFPFDKIKIDRSFVHNLGESADSQAIVRAIVSLGTSLGITITAEGVETERDLACLRDEGCHQGQGYLFAKAVPPAEAARLLAAGNAMKNVA